MGKDMMGLKVCPGGRLVGVGYCWMFFSSGQDPPVQQRDLLYRRGNSTRSVAGVWRTCGKVCCKFGPTKSPVIKNRVKSVHLFRGES